MLSYSKFTVAAFTIFAWQLCATSPQDEEVTCQNCPQPMRITARHIEGGGIGYNQGYTTLEGFFAWSDLWNRNWVPFLDVRGHAFNNGKFAANTGLGFRYVAASRIWGANAYYDYRNTRRQHYNQASVGLETLGRVWDVRLNGYLPVGDTTSGYYYPKFKGFQGHHLLISRKREFALKGANAEVGFHFDDLKNAPFYLAVGPYYLNGKGKSAWGGSARLTLDLFDYLKLEGSTSYDHLFKWVGQGQLGVSFTFGGKKAKPAREGRSCSEDIAIQKRTFQRVDRMEIVPVDHERKSFFAINPVTQLPYEFIFVNNTSSSNGTIESPYPTLLQAQNASLPYDIIYVFSGDGTTKGMDQGILLKDNQQIWGSANAHSVVTTFGTFTLDPMTTVAPIMTNLSGDVVTLANNNTISGLQIQNGALSGILGSSINGLVAEQNRFLATIVYPAVNLIHVSGNISLNQNSFIINAPLGAPSVSEGVLVNNEGATATFSFEENSFLNQGEVGTTFLSFLDTAGQISILRNKFVTEGSPSTLTSNDSGVLIHNMDVHATVTVQKNLFQNQGAFGVAIGMNGSAEHTIVIDHNRFIAPIDFAVNHSVMFPPEPFTVIPMGVQLYGMGISHANATLTENELLYYETLGIGIQTSNTSSVTSTILRNQIQPGIFIPITLPFPSAGIMLLAFDDSMQTGFVDSNTVSASKSFGMGFATFSTANSSVVFSNNFVTGGGSMVGATMFGGGIAAVVEGPGNLSAKLLNNTLVQNGAEGGILAMNLPIFPPFNGELCLQMEGNTSDTGYTLYNPNVGSGSWPINLEQGYQTNIGLINGVPSDSSVIPPAAAPPTPVFFPVGGPIGIVPAGFCP